MVELLKTRRSIRAYKDIEIEDDKIKLILKAGLLAPSSRGKRPWEFIVVSDKSILEKLSKCRTKGGGPFLKNASKAIVVLANTNETDVWVEDCSIAAILMQMEAHELGIGSCWVQVRNRMHDDNKTAENYIKELLKIEDNYSVECILSLGYSEEKKKSYDESNIDWSKVTFK